MSGGSLFFRVSLSEVSLEGSCYLQFGSLKRVMLQPSGDSSNNRRQFVIVAESEEAMKQELCARGVSKRGKPPKRVPLGVLGDIARRSRRGPAKIRSPKMHKLCFSVCMEQLMDVGVTLKCASLSGPPGTLLYSVTCDSSSSVHCSSSCGSQWTSEHLPEVRCMATLAELLEAHLCFKVKDASGAITRHTRTPLADLIDPAALAPQERRLSLLGDFLDVSCVVWPLPTWHLSSHAQTSISVQQQRAPEVEGKMTLRISRAFAAPPLTIRTLRGRSGVRDMGAQPSRVFYQSVLNEQRRLTGVFLEDLFRKAYQCIATEEGADQTTLRFLSVALGVSKDRARQIQGSLRLQMNPNYIVAELKMQLSFIDNWGGSFGSANGFSTFRKREVARVNNELRKLGVPVLGGVPEVSRGRPSVVGLFGGAEDHRAEDLGILDAALGEFQQASGKGDQRLEDPGIEYRTLMRLLLLSDAQNSASMNDLEEDIPSYFVEPSVVTINILESFLRRHGTGIQVYSECCWLEFYALAR